MGLSLRDPGLELLAEEKDLYPYEAYDFVSGLIKMMDDELQAQTESNPSPNITAGQLCLRCVEFSCSVFGRMSRAVFSSWNIKTTNDIGNIVFHLIEAGVVGAAEGDRIEDFDNLFDMNSALDKPVSYFSGDDLP